MDLSEKRRPFGERIRRLFHKKYLLRLILTSITLFLIPCIIAMSAMLRRSYNEVQRANENSALALTDAFSERFVDKLVLMQNEAYQIAENSRDSQSALFCLQIPSLEQSPYYYYTFMNALDQYSGTNFGLYYAEDDCLITRRGKYGTYGYARYYLGLKSDALINRMRAFMANKSGKALSFCPLYDENTCMVYAAVRVRLGLTRESVLLFARLDELFSAEVQPSAMHYAVLDAETNALIYTTSPDYLIDFSDFDAEKTVQSLTRAGTTYRVFQSGRDYLGYRYVGVMPEESLTSSLNQFYDMARRVLFFFGISLLISMALLIYVTYNPIYRLAKSLSGSAEGSELEVISRSFEQVNDEKSELNMMVIDLLLSNLLYGHPIAESDLENLGLSRYTGCFGVLTFSPQRLNTIERRTLTAEISARLHITCYITDIPGKNHTVMIYLIAGERNAALLDYMAAYLKRRGPEPFELRSGRVVRSINDIHISYADCLSAPDEAPTEPSAKSDCAARSIEQLRDRILAYLQENFRDPNLSQSAVADAFGISVYTLSRLFKNQVGLGFSEYVTGKRLDSAKEMLLTTRLPVNVIAENVGIPSLSYFSRLFKLNFGVSPAKYRSEAGTLDETGAPFS